MVKILFMFLPFLLSVSLVDFMAGFGVLSVGILHGANDLEILSKNFNGKLNNQYAKFLIIYVCVVLLGALFFFTLPGLALLIFIIFSSYHFGEQHWGGRLSTRPEDLVFYTIYGAFIFFMIFTLQYDEVVVVIEKISGFRLSFYLFLYLGTGLCGTLLAWMLLKKKLRIHFLKESLLLLFLAGVFYTGSLLFAFAFYFVFWHSIPSLKDQLKYLYGEINLKSFYSYLKNSIVYWIASLVSLFLIYRYIDFEADYFMPLFFSFLAAITFPHTVVIGIMKHKNA